ncbi:hypothetical protein ACQYE5_003010 [Enterobacter cancerogenus]
MKRPTKPLEAFRSRINPSAETREVVSSVSGSDSNWLLGYRQRHKGSLHQDTGDALRLNWLTVGISPFSRARAGGKHGML